jgi:hypothetical protein
MVINAVCPHCKRVYPVDEQYAGQTFTCETCGNPFTVPVPGVVQPVRPVPAILTNQNFAAPAEISRSRRLAARISFVLCGILYVGTFCCVGSGVAILVLPNAAPPGFPPGLISAFCIGLGAFSAIVATVYLVCGINIRRGGFVSAIIALVVACIHELLILVMIISGLVQMAVGARAAAASPGELAFGLIFYGIFLLALGQLIFYLIKILREPRA